MSAPLDLCAWLRTATRGLPRAIKAVVYEELSAHYQDAFDEQRADGLNAADAHRAALAQLGDARETAHALREIHLAQRHYVLALGASLASLLWVVMGAFFTSAAMLTIVAVFWLFVMLRSFRRLIEARLDAPNVRLPIAMIEVCTLLTIVLAFVADQNPIDYPSVLVVIDPFILPYQQLWEQSLTPIHILLAATVGLIGLGWLLLGERLMGQDARLFQLGTLLIGAMTVTGLGLIGSALSVLLRNVTALQTLVLVVVIAGTARQALFVLLFFRAAYPQRDRKARA
ncbi:MAG: permease prefix domain 1-containing protein [Chloroflexota bacterium]|nr:permease prefix domain 1-containing protein [Chloroflexota bacterium]